MTTPPQPPREPGGTPADQTVPAVGRDQVFELEYAQSEASARKRIIEFVLGTVVTSAAVLGSSFFCVTIVSVGSMGGMIAAPLVVAAILGITAFNLRKKPDSRAFAAGIWTGIAVALLLDGVCWIVILNSRIGGG